MVNNLNYLQDKNNNMFGAAEILMMQQLTTMNNVSSYRHNSDSEYVETKQKIYKNNKVMLMALHELDLDGSTRVKTINIGYIKCMTEFDFHIGKLEGWEYKETGETVKATQITFMDGDSINVTEPMQTVVWRTM